VITRLAAFLCVLLYSCDQPANKPPRPINSQSASQSLKPIIPSRVETVIDRTSNTGYQLEITKTDGVCAVRYQGKTQGRIKIVPKPPCYFLRRESDDPQVYSYPKVGVQAVLIIVGTPASADKRQLWNLPSNLFCGEETQAILIKEGVIMASEAVLRGGMACKDKGADEKDFYFFAHPK
jgi:hypothetical protein